MLIALISKIKETPCKIWQKNAFHWSEVCKVFQTAESNLQRAFFYDSYTTKSAATVSAEQLKKFD